MIDRTLDNILALYEGNIKVIEEDRQGWWGYEDRKHGQKTGELRSYLSDKERKRKRREERK